MRRLLAALLAAALPAQVEPAPAVETFALGALLDRMGAREPNTVEKELAGDELRAHHRDEVLLAVHRFVAPPLADGELVQALGTDTLIARCRPEQAAWIRSFLAGLLDAELDVVLMEKVQLRTVPEAAFRDWLDGPRQPDAPEATLTWIAVAAALDGEDAAIRLAALRELGRARHDSFAAHLPIQQGSMYGGAPVTVVLAWDEVRVEGGDVVVAPRTKELFEGFRFRLQRVPLPDGREGYGLEAEHHELRRPVETLEVETGIGPRTVHVPEVTEAHIDLAAAASPDAKAVVFARLVAGSYHVVVVEHFRKRKLR